MEKTFPMKLWAILAFIMLQEARSDEDPAVNFAAMVLDLMELPEHLVKKDEDNLTIFITAEEMCLIENTIERRWGQPDGTLLVDEGDPLKKTGLDNG